MGGLRAAVGVVLGVISLAVLSLHIALCIHYPSPLFAVTLLLNPSLWLFLGLIGMGCALLLTHRDQQRKVRAGHCVSCHPHYGSTVDTKWRAPDAKWHGEPHYQRGPSRAIYSYNGNLHKFYASYGTINEKQLIEMKHSTPTVPVTSDKNGKNAAHCPPEEIVDSAGVQNDLNCITADSSGKEDPGNSAHRKNVSDNNDHAQLKGEHDCQANDGQVSSEKERDLPPCDDSNCSGLEDSKSNETLTGKESQITKEIEPEGTLVRETSTVNAAIVGTHIRPQEMLYRERRYCDCMARYGAIYHYSQLQKSDLPPQCNKYGIHDRAMGRYDRKLMMRCKLKPTNDVPVELFAAKGIDSSNVSKDSDKKDGSSKVDTKSEGVGQGFTDEKPNCENDTGSISQKSAAVGEGDTSSAQCTDSTSLSSGADISTPKESTNQAHSTIVSSDFIVPLKHMSHFSTQTSTSLPLGSPYNGKSKHADHVEDHESTSLSSDQTASEQDLRDQDVVSISSKSSLLPSSPEKSITNRDLTRSPLWRPFKSSIISRKRFSDEEKSSSEETSKGQHHKRSATGHESTNEDSHDSPAASLKSVFTSKRPFTKSGTDSQKTSLPHQSSLNDSISSDSTSSLASPDLKGKRRQQSDSSKSTKSKTLLSRKITSSKAQSLQKNSRTLLLSPAKAVRSLVFRNAQKRSSRARKAADDRMQQGELTPAKLPLLSPPNTEPGTLESSITTAKPPPPENSGVSLTNVNYGSSTPSAHVSSVLPSEYVITAASATCSVSTSSIYTSKLSSPVGTYSPAPVAKSPTIPSARTRLSSQSGDTAKEQPSSSSTQEPYSHFAAEELICKTRLISSPAISSTSPALAAAPTTSMVNSSSPGGSPSVRPKDPKKPKIRLKGKHRSRAAESVMLLAADSDE